MTKTMTSRFRSRCAGCAGTIGRGTAIVYNSDQRRAYHVGCTTTEGAQVAFDRRDHSSAEDRCCGDAAYEDACARACGL
jgi:hypothetical protein